MINISNHLNSILPLVEKPGRYTGGEFNQIRKEWDSVLIKVALAFPDVYEIGLPNLGLAILYSEINKRKDSLAERVYAPWIDFEKFLREKNIPLFSLENKVDLKSFDVIGFSLPYETLYTNVLNMLELSGIAIHNNERQLDDPIIIAGGHACFNPEPMHAFIDAFVIGDGEEVIHEILDVLSIKKLKNISRDEIIDSLAIISGVYVPSVHKEKKHSTHQAHPSSQNSILKCVVNPLPPHITDFLVPNIDVVHNRISIEIMRGCTRGCRFCQAGMISRPVRERSKSEIISTAKMALANTGFEDLSLLSLSTSDYDDISSVLIDLQKEFSNNRQKISLPSLRIESFSTELMDIFHDERKGNFTLAPEAATENLRSRINKPITSQSLIDVAKRIYTSGWESIKLYFMIGFPEETDDDIHSICDLCIQVKDIGKRIIGHRAKLNLSINTFIPKPHTPFQWAPFALRNEVKKKQQIIRERLQRSTIKVSMASFDSSLLEALLCRGNRGMAEVIFDAWKNGARFDSWRDQYNAKIWFDAFMSHGYEPETYLSAGFDVESSLPWDHISTGVSKEYLIDEFNNSKVMKIRGDCRDGCFSCGIQTAFHISCKDSLHHE